MGRADQFTHDLANLEKNWVHSQKKTYGYKERDQVKRAIYVKQIAAIDPADIVYADEAGRDSRADYAYGWNEQGKLFHALKSGRRQDRVNMIAAYCNRQLMAPFTIEGLVIEWSLKPGLKPA